MIFSWFFAYVTIKSEMLDPIVQEYVTGIQTSLREIEYEKTQNPFYMSDTEVNHYINYLTIVKKSLIDRIQQNTDVPPEVREALRQANVGLGLCRDELTTSNAQRQQLLGQPILPSKKRKMAQEDMTERVRHRVLTGDVVDPVTMIHRDFLEEDPIPEVEMNDDGNDNDDNDNDEDEDNDNEEGDNDDGNGDITSARVVRNFNEYLDGNLAYEGFPAGDPNVTPLYRLQQLKPLFTEANNTRLPQSMKKLLAPRYSKLWEIAQIRPSATHPSRFDDSLNPLEELLAEPVRQRLRPINSWTKLEKLYTEMYPNE